MVIRAWLQSGYSETRQSLSCSRARVSGRRDNDFNTFTVSIGPRIMISAHEKRPGRKSPAFVRQELSGGRIIHRSMVLEPVHNSLEQQEHSRLVLAHSNSLVCSGCVVFATVVQRIICT